MIYVSHVLQNLANFKHPKKQVIFLASTWPPIKRCPILAFRPVMADATIKMITDYSKKCKKV